MENEIKVTRAYTSFAGEKAVSVYQCKVIASALDLYAKTKMKVNRAYTPKAMLSTASHLTGQTFKRGQYAEAAQALRQLAYAAIAEIKVTREE